MSTLLRSRPLWRAVLLLLTLLVFGASDVGFTQEQVKEDPASAFAKLESGMTADQVRQRVGTPKHIARQILYHRYLEQWIYDGPVAARLQFDCPRGQQPQLLWKRTLTDKARPGRGVGPR